MRRRACYDDATKVLLLARTSRFLYCCLMSEPESENPAANRVQGGRTWRALARSHRFLGVDPCDLSRERRMKPGPADDECVIQR